MQRRRFLSLFAGAVFPPTLSRYPDPATELEVIRLTDPAYSAYLPRHGASRRGNFLLYVTDRTGTAQVHRMDLKSGESRQLTDAESLAPETLRLLPDDRGFLYTEDNTLQVALLNGRVRSAGSIANRTGALSVSEDGQYCAFVDGGQVRLTALGPKPETLTIAEVPGGALLAAIRPRRSQVLYVRRDGSPWLVDFTGRNHRPLKLDPLSAADAQSAEWTPQGRTFAYLRQSVLREHAPDENLDRLIGNTSQFASFGINADSSVFVGASRSKASAYILLLLRVTRREFTLCEHRSSNPLDVSPVFTPNSQSILFQSDRHGKPAIYRMRVDKLVEATGDEPG